MNKWRIVAVGALSMGLLAGCSSEVSKEKEPIKPKTTQTESKPAPKQPTQEELNAQAKADVTAYMDSLMPVLQDYKTIMGSITKLANMGGSDPTLLTNEAYLEATDNVGDAINRVNNNYRAIDPGTNPTVLKLHNIMLQIVDKMQFVADTYPQAVRNMDVDGINQSASAIVDVSDLIAQAKSIVESEVTDIMQQ